MEINNNVDHTVIFDEDLISLEIEANDYKEAIYQLSQNLLKKSYVKETYPKALIKREGDFPTGLVTNTFGVAIPHADTVHVNNDCISIGVLKNSIVFRRMDTGMDVPVSVLFMLAITNASAQLKMLQRVIKILQHDESLIRIRQTNNKQEVFRIVENFLGDVIRGDFHGK